MGILSHKVKITDPKSPLYGQILDGACIYIDIYHIGSGGIDLYRVTDNSGNEDRLLSTQIDVEHYEKQLRAEEIARLGADVGDTVMIDRTGGGSFKVGFSTEIPHVITKISPGGYVEFDNGEADCFRPDVRVVADYRAKEATGA